MRPNAVETLNSLLPVKSTEHTAMFLKKLMHSVTPRSPGKGAVGQRVADSVTRAKLRSWRHVLTACILRDMMTRFGGSYYNYIIAILWPCVHLGVLLLVYTFVNAISPIGSEPAVFAATGIFPYILCMYPARLMATVVLQSKSLLQFPHVKPIDLIIGRAVLEMFNAAVVTLLFGVVMYNFNVQIMPVDVYEAACAIAIIVLLGISIGVLNVVLTSLFGVGAILGTVMTMTVLYISSGAFIPVTMLSSTLMAIDLYNPLLHCVEWLRFAFFGADTPHLSKGYLLLFCAVSLCFGLAGERFLRGRII